MNEQVVSIASLAELPAAARQLAAAIAASGRSVVAFEGEMGAGKTTLIRALCAELGVTDEVSSPTFALINEYRGGQGQPVYHFDFYRLDSAEEAARVGAVEYFDSGYLCLVEWPTRVAELLPPHQLLVALTATGPESRQLRITHAP